MPRQNYVYIVTCHRVLTNWDKLHMAREEETASHREASLHEKPEARGGTKADGPGQHGQELMKKVDAKIIGD